jgi:hypothetical protein
VDEVIVKGFPRIPAIFVRCAMVATKDLPFRRQRLAARTGKTSKTSIRCVETMQDFRVYWLLRISVPKQSSKQQREQQYRLLLDVEMERKRI